MTLAQEELDDILSEDNKYIVRAANGWTAIRVIGDVEEWIGRNFPNYDDAQQAAKQWKEEPYVDHSRLGRQ